jgi:dienelactone hydrolase
MDLGPYSDLPKQLNFNSGKKENFSRDGLFNSFGKLPKVPEKLEVRREPSFIYDGLEITPLTWWCGYGPETKAFLVRPQNSNEPLPGIVYLHSHDDVKRYGIEKVFDYGVDLPEEISWVRRDHYENQAPVNELAKKGFAVLVFDCFLWGSRRFPADDMPARLKEILGSEDYENLSVMHESMVLSKYLSLFGSTLAGLLNFDDRVALEVAKSLSEFSDQIAVVGLSGGGSRAIYLHATNPELSAVVSVGAMATYESMLEKHVAPHSWMFFPHDLASQADWPQLAMISNTPLLVQYCAKDQLYTLAGMQNADEMLKVYFEKNNTEYKGDFYEAKHSFTTRMQNDAFRWLKDKLFRN